jgi:hypothetical protein
VLPPNRRDDDPAYDVERRPTGRHRYLQEARLRRVRSPHAQWLRARGFLGPLGEDYPR